MRTATIKCNQYFYDNEWQKVVDYLDVTVDRIDRKENTILIRCQCDQFDKADNYPEYILKMSNKHGIFNVVSFDNTGRFIS